MVLVVLSSLLLILSTGCKKEEAAAVAAAAAGTTTPVVKDLFSTNWSVSNNAWELNWGLGNLTGVSFSSQVTYSGGGTCNCNTEINGSQTSGSYYTDCSVGGQVLGTPTAGTCDGLDYAKTAGVAVATYANTNGILTLCRNGTNNCTLIYH